MSHSSIPKAYVKSVLQNGVGRYICQMQRVTLKFCKSKADSRGMRDFIENHLLEFTRANPGIVVYLKPRRHRAPALVAEYLNGNMVSQTMAMKSQEEICKWLEHLRCRSGVDIVRLSKMWHTDTPSIQGVWTPFTNRDTALNLVEFPDATLSRFRPCQESATEVLLRLAEQQRMLKDVAATEPNRLGGSAVADGTKKDGQISPKHVVEKVNAS